MDMGRSSFACLSALLLAVAACGGSAGDSTEASNVMMTDLGKYAVAVATNPDPPIRGVNTVTFTISDAAIGTPAEDLALDVLPWMPSHAHGTSVEPTVKELGGGVYQVENVYLIMPGRWELRTSFSDVGDHVTPTFDVP